MIEPQSPSPIYRLRQVTRSYQNRQVLEIEHLDIAPGEILAIVGPSGAGKSTLLRLLNFLEPPSQGVIYYHAHQITPGTEIPLRERQKVTTVFQQPVMLSRSVEANVAFGLKLRGAKNIAERVGKSLSEVGLANLAEQNARKLSGGEAQRVALARALVLKPEVLLLDEPTANLDPYNVGLIENIIQEQNRGNRTTIVLVTHNVFQARRLAHRVAFLLEGRLIEVAEADSFFNAPHDPRTGYFARGEMIY